MKVLYINRNYILSSLFEEWAQSIIGRFADIGLNFAQEVSKIVWTEFFTLYSYRSLVNLII